MVFISPISSFHHYIDPFPITVKVKPFKRALISPRIKHSNVSTFQTQIGFSHRHLTENICPPSIRCSTIRHYAKSKAPPIRRYIKDGDSSSDQQAANHSTGRNKKSPKSRQGRGIEGKYVYVISDLYKYIGDQPILDNVNLQIYQGAKIGILGVNGCGKSTLLRIMAGLDDDFDGRARIMGRNRIGLLEQEPELDITKTVFDNVLDGIPEKVEILRRYKVLNQRLESQSKYDNNDTEETKGGITSSELAPLSQAEQIELAHLKELVKAQNLLDLERRIQVSMQALRCPPGNSSIELLSGGECRRIALCRLLISSPDILLLDEPTNHLDADSVAWLERYLSEYKGTVMAVTHDRYFLNNVAGWILEIDRGRMIPFDGNYTEWLISKESRIDLEKKKEASRGRQIKQELEWIQTCPKARQGKNKARITRYQDLVTDSLNTPQSYETGKIMIPPGPRLGKVVVEVQNLTKKFGDRVLFQNLCFKLEPGSIVGVIGPNGIGKSTLFKLLTGDLQADEGHIKLGESVEMRHISQTRVELLDDNETVVDAISEGDPVVQIGGRAECHVRAYLSCFNLKGAIQERLVGDLSGGERNRVLLAKVLKNGCNLLLLDEPSNDLDVDTLRSLEEALLDFVGCAIIISHDRWFLDRICTHIMAFEGNTNVNFFEGNYSAYELDRLGKMGAKSNSSRAKFHRIVHA